MAWVWVGYQRDLSEGAKLPGFGDIKSFPFRRWRQLLPEHRFRVFPIPLLHVRCIGCLLELPGLKSLQKFTLVLIQPAHLGPPRWVLVAFRLGMIFVMVPM